MYEGTLDLKELPIPALLEELDYLAYKERLKSYIEALQPSYELRESDDLMLLIEAYIYEEMHRDTKINEKIKTLLSTYAKGADLDHVCLTNYGTTRLENESDEDFLIRSLYSLQQASTTGSRWAYLFHAQTAHEDINCVEVYRKHKAITEVSEDFVGKSKEEIESLLYDFFASYATVYLVAYPFNEEIESALNETMRNENIAPMTDNLVIKGAIEKSYIIDAVIYFDKYIEQEIFLSEIKAELEKLKDDHAIGRDVPLSKIYNILHANGVSEVELISPDEKLIASKDEILLLDSYNLRAEWSRDE
jgi:phage-related baseplate assembly protein